MVSVSSITPTGMAPSHATAGTKPAWVNAVPVTATSPTFWAKALWVKEPKIGAIMLERFSWIIFVFGGILVVTGARMFSTEEHQVEPDKNPIVRIARRILPFSGAYDGQRFFTKSVDGRLMATPLLLVLLVVEWTDLVFAIDSIPAIFAITRDPFLVYSSNVFAILGLRALFFVLAGLMDKFTYLKPGVALILIFVGIKMLASYWVHIPILVSLAVILLTLTGAIVLSILKARAEDAPA